METDISVRFMIILDRQANGTAATIGEIFQDADIRTFNNLSNSLRFRVLRDICYTFEREFLWDGTNYVSPKVNVEMEPVYLKVDIPLEFGATPSGVITDVRSNNLLLAAFTTSGTVPIQFRSRIRYDDK